MAIFNSYVSHYQRVVSHWITIKSSLNHYFPMVFLWFQDISAISKLNCSPNGFRISPSQVPTRCPWRDIDRCNPWSLDTSAPRQPGHDGQCSKRWLNEAQLVQTFVDICKYPRLQISIYVYMYTCIYIYVYMYIYIFRYVHALCMNISVSVCI